MFPFTLSTLWNSLQQSIQTGWLHFYARFVFWLAWRHPLSRTRATLLHFYYAPLFSQCAQQSHKNSSMNPCVPAFAFLWSFVLIYYSRYHHAIALQKRTLLERRKYLVHHSMYPYKRDSWAEFNFWLFASQFC